MQGFISKIMQKVITKLVSFIPQRARACDINNLRRKVFYKLYLLTTTWTVETSDNWNNISTQYNMSLGVELPTLSFEYILKCKSKTLLTHLWYLCIIPHPHTGIGVWYIQRWISTQWPKFSWTNSWKFTKAGLWLI